MPVTQRSRGPGTGGQKPGALRWENTIEAVTYTIVSLGWETVKLVGALKPPLLPLDQMQMKGG
jgi:hypothetical protein